MQQFLNMIETVMTQGINKDDRTGVGTRSVFGHMEKFDLRKGFPLVTVKKTKIDSIIKELFWFIRGETNTETLGCGIWDEWAANDGECGPIYGYQWRRWNAERGDPGVDQLSWAIDRIKTNPDCRRIIVSAWNVEQLDEMCLHPCHIFFQFNVNGGRLDMTMYQRSCDLLIGVPFNIASYSILLDMVAMETGYEAGIFTHMYGDLHIYRNHWEQAEELLTRNPKRLPELIVQKKPFFEIGPEDVEIKGYESYPFMKLEIAV